MLGYVFSFPPHDPKREISTNQTQCWMLHCHILQHMIMGMQSVWVMGEWEGIARIPYSGAEGYLEYGGTAYGGEDISPVSWHTFDE